MSEISRDYLAFSICDCRWMVVRRHCPTTVVHCTAMRCGCLVACSLDPTHCLTAVAMTSTCSTCLRRTGTSHWSWARNQLQDLG